MKRVCGLDVHKDSIFCCISDENGVVFQEKFDVLTSDLLRLVSCLQEYCTTEVQWRVQVSIGCPSGVFLTNIPSEVGKPLFGSRKEK